MNDIAKSKLNRFMQDVAMTQAVKEVIRNAFLKGKGQRDVQILAAERLAVDLLDDAWRELEKFKDSEGNPASNLKQVGM